LATAGERKVWTVSEVTAAIARRFDDIPPVWVEGEIQDLRRRGGQVYFSLADGNRIPASMNTIVFGRIAPVPGDGMRVQVYGRPQFWPRRSEVSVRAERIEHVGEGALRAEIERIRKILESEGLLDPARKRTPPLLPRAVGLLTSAVGAARDDFVRNAWARFPNARIITLDIPVQGDSAPAAIARAIPRLAEHPEVDVIVVTRGGGSLEDLMAFNAERVARAIADCVTPVISAVGHERDATLSDLVADVRVSTPTAAAVAAVPDEQQLLERLAGAHRGLQRRLLTLAVDRRARVARAEERTAHALRGRAAKVSERVVGHRSRLLAGVRATAARQGAEIGTLRDRIGRSAATAAGRSRSRVGRSESLLAALAPSATVARGYAIVRDSSGAVIVSAAAAEAGTDLEVELPDGQLPVTVRADVRD